MGYVFSAIDPKSASVDSCSTSYSVLLLPHQQTEFRAADELDPDLDLRDTQEHDEQVPIV